MPALSDKDEADLRWGLSLGADMIALSFVRDAKDIVRVHEIMDEEGVRLPVIAKIEKPQAVDNLTEIIDAFDGVMVARGDLGVELPLEEVPLVQKRAIEIARRNAKPVIVATQVLESMIENSRPTRAEASDCANAVLDGADAIMLSGETSVGKWPIEAVRDHGQDHREHRGARPRPRGRAGHQAAHDRRRRDGRRGRDRRPPRRQVPRHLHRPPATPPSGCRASAASCRCWRSRPNAATRSQLALTWGIETFQVPMAKHTDQIARQVDVSLLESGRCVEGDTVVIVAGSPPGIPGSTNALRVHHVGDAVNKVAPAYEELDNPPSGPDSPARRRPRAVPRCCGRACPGYAVAAPGRGGGMADTGHSKCSARKGVRVQVPPSARRLGSLTCGNAEQGPLL